MEGLLLKVKLQYFGHPMRRTDSLEKPWCWERLKAGEEGNDRGWDGWMASLTQWKWVWVNSGSWWWTGRSGVLRSMGSQRVGYDWVTELNWMCRNGLDGCEFEWTPGVGDGQGGLACWGSWGRKESDMTEQLNWTDWATLGTVYASMLSQLGCGSDCKESTCNAVDLIRSLGQEDPLRKGMATHSGIIAWRFPWAEEPGWI